MTHHEQLSWQCLDALLSGVERPARYIGGEINSVHKDDSVRARLALCFPDLYEIAESYLGFKILYDIVNRRHEYAAERVYAVAPDLEARMRSSHIPLWSLEDRRPLRSFDIAGFTLQYELSYPTILAMLELGGVSLRTADRRADEPFVVGGGAGAVNPEPIAPFFDAFLIGDGEEAILELLDVVAHGRAAGLARAAILFELGKIRGVYVPAHFAVEYDGLRVAAIRSAENAPSRGRSRHGVPHVVRRSVASLETSPYPLGQIQPNVKPVHDRLAIEIQRGCSRGCRFCQAGMIQRPTRQRSPRAVLAAADQALRDTCVNTLGLLSLSAGDYDCLNDVLAALLARCEPEQVALSLPSLRTETLTPEVAMRVCTMGSTSFTVAPEAGSERLRRVINKTNTEDDLLRAVQAAVSAGARSVKLYFMIGLPTETDADLDAIIELARQARAAGRRVRRDAQVTVSVSTFVPKPHTPFQWEAQITAAQTLTKQSYLRQRLRQGHIALRYQDAEQSFVEGVLCRGDRRLADVLEAAMRAGSRLDGWSDWFDASRWNAVLTHGLAQLGLTPDDYLGTRSTDDLLPWDHLHAGLLRKFLLRERQRAYAETATDDCARGGHCYACGACDHGDPYLNRTHHDASRRALLPVTHAPSAALSAPPLDDALAAAVAPPPAPPAAERVRLRFRYEKVGAAIHFSQLEAVDQLLRAIRHSRLPVVFSQGYTRRPRVSFSPACPTGIESEAEYVDALCVGVTDVGAWVPRLNGHLPAGLRVVEGRALTHGEPVSLTEQISAVVYSVYIPELADVALGALVADFCARGVSYARVLRKGAARVYDVRAAVKAVEFVPGGIELTLAFGTTGAVKLSEALTVLLGSELAPRCRARKLRLVLGGEPTSIAAPPLDAAAIITNLVNSQRLGSVAGATATRADSGV